MAKEKIPKIEIPKGKYLEDIYWDSVEKLSKENKQLKTWVFVMFLIGLGAI